MGHFRYFKIMSKLYQEHLKMIILCLKLIKCLIMVHNYHNDTKLIELK